VPSVKAKQRTRPLQVIAVGLSRSGTESLRNALLKLGYDPTQHGFDAASSVHDLRSWSLLGRRKWNGKGGERVLHAKDFDTIIGECSAVTDMPTAAFTKVILTTRRDLDAWYESNLSTFSVIRGPWLVSLRSRFHADLYWLSRGFKEVFYQYHYEDFERTENGCIDNTQRW